MWEDPFTTHDGYLYLAAQPSQTPGDITRMTATTHESVSASDQNDFLDMYENLKYKVDYLSKYIPETPSNRKGDTRLSDKMSKIKVLQKRCDQLFKENGAPSS